MKAIIATDVAIYLCNSRYYYASQVSAIIERYYKQFGILTLCGRVREAESITSSFVDVTDMIDKVVAIPSLEKAMIGAYNSLVQKAVAESDLVICRCPGVVSSCAADAARKLGKKVFAESMGCAWDAYWNHGIVGKIAAPYMFYKMRKTVYNADYALYVTNEFLQKRYPCKNESVGVSNVLIKSVDDEVLMRRLEKIAQADYSTVTIMTTAAIDVRYKGQEFVIKAIPELNKAGIRVRYLLVGGGYDTYLRGVAQNCGVEDQVEFIGRRPLNEVFELLDTVDIYIQPSLQEGLPRSVIEAMSRGCPAIGARTAGIPELISAECVVKRKSASEIAQVIQKIANPQMMRELAIQNFTNAKGYLDSVLNEKRTGYFKKISEENNRNGEK